MAKHVIFIVHGMGDHKQGWSQSSVAALRDNYKTFRIQGSFADRFHIKEIHYGQAFVDYWNKHDEIAASLGKLKAPSSAFSAALLSLAKKVPKDELRSHVGDVFLYTTTLFNEPVTLDVDIKIEKELRRLGFPNYSIIAHSLGARVIHDTLQRSFTDRDGSYVLRAKPTVLMMVSNVTRLASFNSKELQLDEGLVVFPSNDSRAGACQHYVNANHPLDAVGVIRKYQPQFSSDPNYHEPEIELTDFTSKEIHTLAHYCAHPTVAAAFFNQVIAPTPFDPDPVSAVTHKQALLNYRQNTVKQSLKSLRDDLVALEPAKFGSWKVAIQKLADFVKLIKSFSS